MKSAYFVLRIVVLAATGLFFSGCLLKQTTVSIRHFVLAPALTNEPVPATTEHLSVGIGLVKMPPYLLRNSIAVRNDANEIEYFEDAVWAERLDQGFQRTVAANLSRILSSNSIYVADWRSDQVMAKVFIDVEQFDVDTSGRGTLVASWRIVAPGTDRLLKSGKVRLGLTGGSPRRHPEVVAATLSGLTTEFSRELAKSIRDSIQPNS